MAIAKAPGKGHEAPAADAHAGVHHIGIGRRTGVAYAGAEGLVRLAPYYRSAPVRHVMFDAAAAPAVVLSLSLALVRPGAAAVGAELVRWRDGRGRALFIGVSFELLGGVTPAVDEIGRRDPAAYRRAAGG